MIHQKYPQWQINLPQPVAADVLEAAGMDPLAAQVLTRRGIRTAAEARAFLDPGEFQPCSPWEMPGMQAAVERLHDAIRRKEKICVWGDFDVDGQTATALLVDSLGRLGADVDFHIPVRGTESHGVNKPGVQKALNAGARLILTCDTGISAVEAAAFVRSQGADLIITDHHELPADLPDALAIVNPHFLSAGHALSSLPGVGVAYQLALALARLEGRPEIAEDQLDLVALGIVADVADQRGDTRWLLQVGLERLHTSPRPGIRALCASAGVEQPAMDEESIAFALAPRLNALGRLSDANQAVEFFLTRDESRADSMARELEALNYQRRIMVEQVFKAACARVNADPALAGGPVIVLDHPEWPAGVAGIAAARLVEIYEKPAVIICSPPGSTGRASARSIEGVNIIAAITECSSLLLGFGGHAMAAGLAIIPENIPEFRRQLRRAVDAQTGGVLPPRILQVDAEIPLTQADLKLAQKINSLGPFGNGNPALVFVARSLDIKSYSYLGKSSEHLKIWMADQQGKTFPVLWWSGGEMAQEISPGLYDLAYRLHAHSYRGEMGVQLEWVDARLVAPAPLPLELRSGPRLVDLRTCQHPARELEVLRAAEPALLVWREGSAEPVGVDRRSLRPAPVLAVWSAPPGPDETLAALQAARPAEILVFARPPEMDSPAAFLKTLLGMLKYKLNRKMHEINLDEIAAAAGHRAAAVRLGLDCLAARGLITVVSVTGPIALIEPGGAIVSLEDGDRRLAAVLKETTAYREFFRRLPLASLFPEYGGSPAARIT